MVLSDCKKSIFFPELRGSNVRQCWDTGKGFMGHGAGAALAHVLWAGLRGLM